MNYEGFAVRSTGYSHIKKGTVCQDSVQYVQDMNSVTVAVADGHGSTPYFRSERGSTFAAEIACRKISEFLKKSQYVDVGEKQKNEEIKQLIHSIITEWRICVREDLLKYPFSNSEITFVPEKYITDYNPFTEANSGHYTQYELKQLLQPENNNILKAYGTTLLCLGMCDEYCIGVHIGDGKCVAIYEDGSMNEPIPWDDKCYLNVCTSICDKNAAEEFRYYIWKDKLPVAVFVATDGIDDTFANMLHSFYRNIALDLSQSDFRFRVRELSDKLPEISRLGSQDDVSIGGIVDVLKLREITDTLQNLSKLEGERAKLNSEEQKLTELMFRLDSAERILNSCNEDETEKTLRYQCKVEQFKDDVIASQERISAITAEIKRLENGESLLQVISADMDYCDETNKMAEEDLNLSHEKSGTDESES